MSYEALETADRAVAVIGVGAVLPDAPDAMQFWDNVASARYSITDVPAGRWDPSDYFDPDPKAVGKTYSKIGGWVRDFKFDSLKYRIPPRVAAAMDQAQMWGIAATREALADAGHPDRPLNLDRTAAIVGNAMGGQLHYMTTFGVMAPPSLRKVLRASKLGANLDPAMRDALEEELVEGLRGLAPGITEDSMPGELANVVAGRIANVFDLHGPNYICDAACASSLAALDAAIEGLLARHYDAVVCGGVDRNMGPATFVKFCKVGALSPDGSRPFAKGANGFVMGEGAAMYVLKRLADAERDGDRIYAVIRAVGGASDGKGKGITAPNPEGQKRAVIRAYERAGFPLSTVTQIEAHGTSTIVGDVAEVAAINELYRGVDLPKRSVALGSIKSQIGHLKAAAGAAGLLKGILALHHKVLAPSAQFAEPNPNIRFEDGPLFVNTEARPWERPANVPRRLGVSAFGFGGTNFHVALEEHVPGMLTQRPTQVQMPAKIGGSPGSGVEAQAVEPPMLRGMAMVHGQTLGEVRDQLVKLAEDAAKGLIPPRQLPSAAAMSSPERVAIDFGSAEELETRAKKAIECVDDDRPAAWRLARGKAIFRGLEAPGKIAFLFPGQGSQYVNMLRELREVSSTVRRIFDEADEVMRDRLDGRILTELIFVDSKDESLLAKAEEALRHTTVTQPAMLAADIALSSLLQDYGIAPDMVMGHSLGEYAALVAAGVMPFADALIAVSARAREMANVSLADSGKMAGVIGLYEKIPPVLDKVNGYVVAANRNSHKQTVIAGGSDAVEQASEMLRDAGLRVIPLNVSHAFHSNIVAPASEPLRRVIQSLHIKPPTVPVVANVDGKLYPMAPDSRDAIIDRLARQIAAPVQFVDGLETLYESGVRVFVEVGPKKVLASFAEEVLSERGDIVALATNNPKKGPEASFGAALAYLYSIGRGNPRQEPAPQPRFERVPDVPVVAPPVYQQPTPPRTPAILPAPPQASSGSRAGISQDTTLELGRIFADFLDRGMRVYQGANHPIPQSVPTDAQGSVVVSGAGVGLPGLQHRLFDDEGVDRILRGEQLIGPVPANLQDRMVDKNVVRLIKSETEGPRLDLIADTSEVLHLAGRRGPFDLVDDFGIAEERANAYDVTTAMAIGAGIEALRDAGIPLVRRYRKTSKGTYLPDRWMLPEPLADETGVVFASAFPGYNRFAELMAEYHSHRASQSRIEVLERARKQMSGADAAILDALIAEENKKYEDKPYRFERKFLFEILAMGHSQFAELIGARGPNTQVNSACSSTTLAVATAEDWIRSGRCNRVLVIAADDVTSDSMLEWIGAGFLATGAATTEADVTQAALPFDRRRHGMILGMGACALVVESEDAVRARGMRAIAEIIASDMANSAFHGTRLDVNHICSVMNRVITTAEQRHGIDRREIAPHTVFISHETYTPARGGSASAEVYALRTTFGESASDIVIANTKGFTGHPMGVGIEDALAVKVLERRVVPPIPNFREVDPELGKLNLSRGGSYPVDYALRFSAGFGSQLAITLYRRIAGKNERTSDAARYQQWLSAMSGYADAATEVEKRTLRIKDQGLPAEVPRHTGWQYGQPPRVRVSAPEPSTPTLPSAAMDPVALPSPFPTPVPPTPAPASTPPAPASATDDFADKVIAIVADKTGYPTDMLARDLDLEADLGIDTVKQAEIFAELRTTFGLPRRDDLKLRDYPTLDHVIGYVRDARGVARPAASTTAPSPVASAPSSVPPAAVSSAGDGQLDAVAVKVIAIVADKTGYPTDMLALDLDLEADLGIDTVKQAEVFAELRSAFDLPRRDDLKLRDYPTLEHVIGYVRQGRPDLAKAPASVAAAPVAAASPAAAPAPSPAPKSASASDDITQHVLQIVADKTGYPTDMLEPDLDLEADLGIDTVKQAEIFAVVRDLFHIPRVNELKLRDYPTLGHVIGFVRDNMTQSSATSDEMAVTEPAPVADSSGPSARRLVPMPMVRLPLAACKPTTAKIQADQRIVVVGDKAGAATKLVEILLKKRVRVLHVDNAIAPESLVKSVVDWAGTDLVDGLFFLPALDAHPSLDEMSPDVFRTLLDHHVRALFGLARALYASFDREGTFLVSATSLGGTFGYGSIPAQNPCAGPVSGFTKAFAREREKAVVKVVDFSGSDPKETIASRLLEEVARDPGAVEVGYQNGIRHGITLVEQACPAMLEGSSILESDSVIVVTGSGGAITSAIAADLAKASGATFHLLDLPPAPKTDDPDLDRVSSDREGLKRDLMNRLRSASSERVTPVMVERELQRIEREAATREGIRAVERAGGKPSYHSCNVTDSSSVDAVIKEILAKHGRIDLIVHAAGLERSRPLDVKEPAEFDLVFDVKAMGMFNLLAATRGADVGAIVSFSSVAGRFGNAGQTDYSAANDFLCKVTSAMRTMRPNTRAFVIDWTAWGSIGMATRGSIPEIMKRAGIEMLDPVAGIPVLRQELESGRRGEIVVCGKLGILTEPRDPDGGAASHVISSRESSVFELVARRADPYEGVVLTTLLDPKQPYLDHHRIEGVPVMPGVMGVELFAQAAAALMPGVHIQAVRDVAFAAPFKCYRDEPREAIVTIRILRGVHGDRAVCTLQSLQAIRGSEKPPEPKLHFAATLLLSNGPGARDKVGAIQAKAGGGTVERDDLYKAYFHGPAFQVLAATQVADDGGCLVGGLQQPMPQLTHGGFGLLTAPRLLELCFQTAGVIEIGSTRKLGLPSRIDEVRVYEGADDSGPRDARVRVAKEGDGLRFDAVVSDDSGSVLLEVVGYHTSALPVLMDEATWAPLRAGLEGFSV
jgi:malonyl CoA-acyl carrier protein transacylase